MAEIAAGSLFNFVIDHIQLDGEPAQGQMHSAAAR